MSISHNCRLPLRTVALAGVAAASLFGATLSTPEPAQARTAFFRPGGVGGFHGGYGHGGYGRIGYGHFGGGYGYRHYGRGGYGYGLGPALALGVGAGLAAGAYGYGYGGGYGYGPNPGGYDDPAVYGYDAAPAGSAPDDEVYADGSAYPEDAYGTQGVYGRPHTQYNCGPYEQQTRLEKRACGR